MMPATSSSETRKQRRLQQLREDMAEVEKELKELERTVTHAQELRAEQKKLRAELARLESPTPKASSSLSKSTIRPQIESLLSDNGGELDDNDLRELIKDRLREQGVPATGLHSIISALKADFGDDDKVWRLEPKSNQPVSTK